MEFLQRTYHLLVPIQDVSPVCREGLRGSAHGGEVREHTEDLVGLVFYYVDQL